MDAIRFDIVSLNSGTTAGAIRSRLETVDPDAKPVVVVRRQLIGSVTWHRLGLRQLVTAIADAGDDTPLSSLLRLDAANQVPSLALDQAGEDPGLAVLLLDGYPVAFSEGALAGSGESTRGKPKPPPTAAAPAAAAPPPAAPAPGAEAPPEESPATDIFTAYPTIMAPTTVKPAEVFEVTVGVSNKKPVMTGSNELTIEGLEPGQETVELEVLVSGPFQLVEGSSNFGSIEVDLNSFAHEPFAVSFTIGPPPDTYDPQVGVWMAKVVAAYIYNGARVGEAHRDIWVNQVGARHIELESEQAPVGTASPVLDFTMDDVDLTISITSVEPGSQGSFNVRLFSKHLPKPVDAGIINLGDDARQFATSLIRELKGTVANPVADEALRTVGRLVAEKFPEVVETSIKAVWEATNGEAVDAAQRRVPDVLLLTDDSAVPWELMGIDLDATCPSFLGAQVNVGRWPNARRERLSANPLGIRRLGVMVGHYQDARGVQPLPRAEEEGRRLAEDYEARTVNADPTALNDLLAGAFDDGFEFEGLHFAGHGETDPDKGTYLMYSDGGLMGIFPVGSAPVAAAKDAFLFVNACQVGTAYDMLGEYAGLAGMAIGAGFRGFIAPLWSVSDDKAQEIALGLYETSAAGETVASYLRDKRTKFRQTETESAHTTYMAYVFFGHPALRLGGPERRRTG